MEGSQANNRGNKAVKGKQTTAERTFRTTNLTCLMECALPPQTGATIHQDAVDAMDRCVTEFAAMVTIVATEQRKKERREVMNGDDVIKAMEMLGYDHYVGPLTEHLHQYRDSKVTVGRGGRRQRAMAAVAPDTRDMAPQLSKFASGMPLYDSMVRTQAVVTREMPPAPPHPSNFTLCPPMYDFMVREPATMAATAAEREMPPTPPHPSDFTLGLPMYDVTVRSQTPLATREVGMNTNIFALWSVAAAAASTSRMPPAHDDE